MVTPSLPERWGRHFLTSAPAQSPLTAPSITSSPPTAAGTGGGFTCLHWKSVAGVDREQLRSAHAQAVLVIREIPGRKKIKINPLRAFKGEIGCLIQEVLQPQIAHSWRSVLGRYQRTLGRLLHPSPGICCWPCQRGYWQDRVLRWSWQVYIPS